MTIKLGKSAPIAVWIAVLLASCSPPCRAVELKVGRNALQRTLKQQLFGGLDKRYFLKGSAHSACSVYADDAELSFVQDRIVVRVKTHARLGQAVRGACLGISLAPTAEVSFEPYGEGETIGFRAVFEPAGSVEHEGKCGGTAAQSAGRFDDVFRV
jgi:hypothetical protein